MPIYNYKCKSCKAELEVLQKISDPIPLCVSCGHNTLEKYICAPNFRFSGNGYYETDEKSADKQKYIEKQDS